VLLKVCFELRENSCTLGRKLLVPVHKIISVRKACIVVVVLNPGIRWRSVLYFFLRALYPWGKQSSAPIGKEASWAALQALKDRKYISSFPESKHNSSVVHCAEMLFCKSSNK
jgi:type II secretory pathway component PulL